MNKLFALTVVASGLLGLTGCGACYNGSARMGYYQPTTTYVAQPQYTQTTYVAQEATVYSAPAPTYTYAAPTYVAPAYTYAAPTYVAPTYVAPAPSTVVQAGVTIPAPFIRGSVRLAIP